MSDGSLLRASRLVLLGLLATSASALTLPPALTQLRQSAMRSLLRDVAPVPSPFALASNFDTRAFNPPDMRESRVTLTFPGNSEQIVNELVSSALSGSSDVFKSLTIESRFRSGGLIKLALLGPARSVRAFLELAALRNVVPDACWA